jgi:23S rRNA (adenine2030-N6)-methyltransferase
MLSYQHGYHAGNLADVHKHRVLAHVLTQLVRAHPHQPITYMETHAGRGVYDLSDAQATKTGESREGILSLLNNKTAFTRQDDAYMQAVKHTQARFGATWYPGSPHIARYILRPDDALCCFELHPQEFAALNMRLKTKNARLYKKDGYAGVLSLSPPSPHSSWLVLIDPSFEIKSEYDKVAEFIPQLLKRWSEAVILLWYPILDAGLHIPMIESLNARNFADIWHHEDMFPADSMLRMKGSGLFAVNASAYGVQSFI